jgi:hypothetical protein
VIASKLSNTAALDASLILAYGNVTVSTPAVEATAATPLLLSTMCCAQPPCARSMHYTAAQTARIGRIGFGTGRQKTTLERRKPPNLPRFTCSPRFGLQSSRGKSAGVAKRPCEVIPPPSPKSPGEHAHRRGNGCHAHHRRRHAHHRRRHALHCRRLRPGHRRAGRLAGRRCGRRARLLSPPFFCRPASLSRHVWCWCASWDTQPCVATGQSERSSAAFETCLRFPIFAK